MPAGGRCCVSQWAGLRWWWELLVRWSLMNPWFAGGAVAQVQWSNGGRCSGPGEEVRIGRGGRAACGWCPLSEWGFCTGGEAGREVAGGRSWLGRGAGRGKEGGGGPRHGVPQQPPFPYIIQRESFSACFGHLRVAHQLSSQELAGRGITAAVAQLAASSGGGLRAQGQKLSRSSFGR